MSTDLSLPGRYIGGHVDDVKHIAVSKILGTPFGLSAKAGEKLFERIHAGLASSQAVVLDFEGVRSVTTVFLNNAVGRLFGKYPADVIQKRLKVINAQESIRALLDLSARNAISYFSDPEAAEARDRELVTDE